MGDGMKKKGIIVLFSMITILSVGLIYMRNVSYSSVTNNIFFIDALKRENNVINDIPDISLGSNMGDDLAGLYKNEDKYYFRGYVINNYVDFNNMIWRIVSFNDNEVKLVLEDGIDNNKEFSFNSDTYITSYEESAVFKELNLWYDEHFALQNENVIKKELLSYDDVINAGASVDNYNESFYLYNGYDTWLLTKKEDNLDMESSIVWYLSNDGLVDSAFTEELKTIRPVITISNLKVLSGNGKESSPYLLK